MSRSLPVYSAPQQAGERRHDRDVQQRGTHRVRRQCHQQHRDQPQCGGRILVNGGAVAVVGGTPTVANTALIRVFGLGDNDVISLNEVNGALPRGNLFGGAGNDVLTGGSGADQLFGQAGNDTLLGKGGTTYCSAAARTTP